MSWFPRFPVQASVPGSGGGFNRRLPWPGRLGESQGVALTFAFEVLDEALFDALSKEDLAILAAIESRISWRDQPRRSSLPCG